MLFFHFSNKFAFHTIQFIKIFQQLLWKYLPKRVFLYMIWKTVGLVNKRQLRFMHLVVWDLIESICHTKAAPRGSSYCLVGSWLTVVQVLTTWDSLSPAWHNCLILSQSVISSNDDCSKTAVGKEFVALIFYCTLVHCTVISLQDYHWIPLT